ncbi:MAG: dihydroorotase family protein [Alphaproteobacteria bacterium]|nr:dihydroorotase family protein [Alphaproteobacteria bacterium]NNF23275.1 dihydroorotase family protein [Paracoccaceae bacterium]
MSELVLTGGTVWTGDGFAEGDVEIAGGKIARVAATGSGRAAQRIDVSGLHVLPGAIDAHIHLGHGRDISRPRVPEDALTETGAAATGGVTCIIPYILSSEPYRPVFDELRLVTEAGARVDFSFHFVIATDTQMAEVAWLAEQGSPTAKLFMNIRGDEGARLGLPGTDDGFLFRLLETLREAGGMLCPHPENIEVAWVLRDRVTAADADGTGGLAAWNDTRPPFVEAEALSRASYFARIVGTPLHAVHTSSGEALAAAVLQREQGSDVSIETCIQYLTDDTESPIGATGKVNPPLRAPADRAALWEGIRRGQIDTIATDHIHRPASSKQGGIWTAQPGFPGLDTFLPALLTQARKEDVAVERMIPLVTRNPARRMGLAGKGELEPGFDADITVLDMGKAWTVEADKLASDAGYSIYQDRQMDVSVVHTLSRGRFALRDGSLSDDSRGHGSYVARKLR